MSIDDSEMREVLRRKKVFTLQYMTQHLGFSRRTAQRRLAQLNTHTSYNLNGRYHALPGVPRFDHFGIWKFRDAFFSRFGNLTKTVVGLVDVSDSGLTVRRLCEILGLPAQSFRTFFSNIDDMYLQKQGRSVVYFSNDDATRQKQLATRHTPPKALPSEAEAVLILVDRIKFPESSLEECARRVSTKAVGVTSESVRSLLDFHGLLKKTVVTRS